MEQLLTSGLSIDNYSLGAIPEAKDLSQATFNNCIIYGSYTNELALSKKTTAAFTYQFNNCLIKYDSATTNPDYQFQADPIHYNAIILNENPKFYDVLQNKLNIEAASPAFAKGNSAFLIPVDILGNTRTLPPDLGAYQSKPFPK